MPVITKTIQLSTRGFCDVVDITPQIDAALHSVELRSGVVTVFVPGATAGLTTLEFEPGCVQDLKEAFERLVSRARQLRAQRALGRWQRILAHPRGSAGSLASSSLF